MKRHSIPSADWVTCLEKGQTTEIRSILEKSSPNRKIRYSRNDMEKLFTLLLSAIDLSTITIAKLFLEKGADVNAKGYCTDVNTSVKETYTPLYLVCIRRKHELIPALIDAGADLDMEVGQKHIPEEEGGTLVIDGMSPCLAKIIMLSDINAAEVLLDCGSDPYTALLSLMTRLSSTDMWDQPQRIRMLLQAGATLGFIQTSSNFSSFSKMLRFPSYEDVSKLVATFNILHTDIQGCTFWYIISCLWTSEYLINQTAAYSAVIHGLLAGRSQVMPLKYLCRRMIRMFFGRHKLFKNIKNLTALPSSLRMYILFYD